MTTLVFTMELRGQMVAVNCEVIKLAGGWEFTDELVIEYPDWKLTEYELNNLRQAALSIREYQLEA